MFSISFLSEYICSIARFVINPAAHMSIMAFWWFLPIFTILFLAFGSLSLNDLYLGIYFLGFSIFWLRGPHEVHLLNALVLLTFLQLHERIISLRLSWVHITSQIQTLFTDNIGVKQENREVVCFGVMSFDIASFSYFSIEFWNCAVFCFPFYFKFAWRRYLSNDTSDVGVLKNTLK